VETLPTDNNNVVLTVRKDGSIYLNEYAANMDTLGRQLITVVKEPARRLFLQADKDVPYGVVVEVMGRIKAAGIEEMGIVAERMDDPAPAASPVRGGGAVRGRVDRSGSR
jgi:biopolymer transport protein TolR